MPPENNKKRDAEGAARNSASVAKANVAPSAAGASEDPAGPSGTVLLDLSGGIPWGDESLDLATRVSRFEDWWNARRQNQTEWKALGKPTCDSCGKKHAPPCIPQDTFTSAVSLGQSLQKDLQAQTAESSTDGAQNAAQKETEKNQADKAKDSKSKTVCNRVCTHCSKNHFFAKKFPNGCKVRPCPACGKGHSAGTCAELRERFIERGIVYNGAHLVANINASHGFVPQPLEEVIERGKQIVSSAPAQYKHVMSALAQRAVQMAMDGAQTGHMTLLDRTKRSMNDDDDSDGGRPAGKKSKRTNPYGGTHLVANTNAPPSHLPQMLEEMIEQGAQMMLSLSDQRDFETMAGSQTGHRTLPDRTKRSMNDDDDSDGGKPAGKKSKRNDPYGRR